MRAVPGFVTPCATNGRTRPLGPRGASNGEPTVSTQRVRQVIRLWLVHRARPVQVADPGLPPRRDKKKGQQERKEHDKQRVLEEYRLGEEPPPRECRGYGRMGPSRKGWTAGSMQGTESGSGKDTP